MSEGHQCTLIGDDTLAAIEQGIVELAEFRVGADCLSQGAISDKGWDYLLDFVLFGNLADQTSLTHSPMQMIDCSGGIHKNSARGGLNCDASGDLESRNGQVEVERAARECSPG